MAYKIQVVSGNKEIPLLGLDDSGDTTAEIRKATGNDQLRLEEIVTPDSFTYKVDGVLYSRQTQTPRYLEMAAKTWLVMTNCNIIDTDDKPLFTGGMKWNEFMAAYDKLPVEARKSLYAAVVAENPHWGDPISGVFA